MTDTGSLDSFIDKIDIKVWDGMSPDERLELLQEFEDIMAELEHREAFKVRVISDEEYERSPGTMGYFDGEGIYINPRFLTYKSVIAGTVSTFSMAKALGNIAHEGRHAWQQYVVEHPELGIVDENTRMMIMINNICYFSSSDDDEDPLYMEKHTLYEAQLIELDARRFQKQIVEYIAQKLTQKNGAPDRVFTFAVHQYVAREYSEAERLVGLFTEEEIMEIEADFMEKLKQLPGFDQMDLTDFSVFGAALALLDTGDAWAFIEGEPINLAAEYKETKTLDKQIDGMKPAKPVVRYKRKRRFV